MSEAYELSRQIFEDNAAETGDNVMLRNIFLLHGYTAKDVTNVVAMQNALARWQHWRLATTAKSMSFLIATQP
jgi:hypothetical protein